MREGKVNRGWLLRQVQAGNVEVKCNYSMTDDYAFDAAYNFGKTDWMPAQDYFKKDGCKLAWYFSTKGGFAYWNEDKSEIAMSVYSNYSLQLRIKAAPAKTTKNRQIKPTPTGAKPDANFLEGLEVVDYSEKAVAIFGDTKSVKEELKAAGARFNMYLSRDGVKTPGWILAKSVYNNLLQTA